MTYLSNAEAVQLLVKLRNYPPQAWSFNVSSRTLSLRTPANVEVSIEYRSYPGWTEEDFGHLYRQYRLSINGIDFGGIDADGRKLNLWEVVDLKGLFETIVHDENIQRKIAEEAAKKAQYKVELEQREASEKRVLLESV
jgi:hypothetical protein